MEEKKKKQKRIETVSSDRLETIRFRFGSAGTIQRYVAKRIRRLVDFRINRTR